MIRWHGPAVLRRFAQRTHRGVREVALAHSGPRVTVSEVAEWVYQGESARSATGADDGLQDVMPAASRRVLGRARHNEHASAALRPDAGRRLASWLWLAAGLLCLSLVWRFG
jgi:hypothetical protein